MSEINNIDFSSYIEELLPIQFQDSENIKAWLETVLTENQKLFDEIYTLSQINTDIDTATGYQLDLIGKLDNVYRLADTDEAYRERIRLERFTNNSSGTIPEILSFCQQTTNGYSELFEHYPASFAIQISAETFEEGLIDRVDELSAAGVNAHSLIHTINGDGVKAPEEDEAYSSTDVQAGEAFMEAGEAKAEATPVLIFDPLASSNYQSAIFPDDNEIVVGENEGIFPEVYS